jgi:ornithine cyclodeaminase
LARGDSKSVLVVGVGTQGTLQVDYLLRVMPGIESVVAYARKQEAVEAYVQAQLAKHPGVSFTSSRDLATAGEKADIIVTTTPSRRPILMVEHVRPGTHVNAIGSDNPGKQEIDPALLARAVYVTDSTAQCARNGELQHAKAAGLMSEDDVHAEIGAIIAGDRPGRTEGTSITIFDSTGLGAQDLAIANLVYDQCRNRPRAAPGA